jgi:hypothetical protein
MLSRGLALGVLASVALLGVQQNAASAETGDQPATPTAVEVFTADRDENADQLSPELGRPWSVSRVAPRPTPATSRRRTSTAPPARSSSR